MAKYFLSEDREVLVRVNERFSDLVLFRNWKKLQKEDKESYVQYETQLFSVYANDASNYVWTFLSGEGTYKIVSDAQERCCSIVVRQADGSYNEASMYEVSEDSVCEQGKGNFITLKI